MLAGYVISKLRLFNFGITKHIVLAGGVLLAALLLFSQGGRSNDTLEEFYENKYSTQKDFKYSEERHVWEQCLETVSDWQSTEWLPVALERRLKALAGQRCLMFTLLGSQDHPATLSSIIERDFMPRSGVEMLKYFPRAMAIGTLSPMPAAWFQRPGGRVSIFYTVIPVEAALVYVGIIGLVLFVMKSRAYSLMAPVLLAIYTMTVYGMATPFIGGLYRYRYPFWAIILCFGVAAIWSLMEKKREAAR